MPRDEWNAVLASFPARNKAIKAEKRKGGSWARQALAGLAALPPGTRGHSERFTHLLTWAGSPLPELPETTRWDWDRSVWKYYVRPAWGRVFAQALKHGLLDYTGLITRRKSRAWAFVYIRTDCCELPPKAEPKPRRVHHDPVACTVCNKSFVPKRAGAVTCSNRCRQQRHRDTAA